MKPSITALLLGCALPGCASASHALSVSRVDADDGAAITRAELEASVRRLASDDMEGRAAAEPGGERAARWLAAQLMASGVTPAFEREGLEGYLQPVPLEKRTVEALPELTVDLFADPAPEPGWAPRHGADFDCADDVPSVTVDDIVRITSADQLAELEHAMRVAGNRSGATAVFVDAPDRGTRSFVEEYGAERLAGVALVLRAGSDEPRRETRPLRSSRSRVRLAGGAPQPVLVRVHGPLLAALRAGEVERLTLTSRTRVEAVTGHNVVGLVPGTGREGAPEGGKLADEALVLSAHFDHLGTRDAKEGEDGVYNGADDNASGTAGVLEIAEALVADPPARTVVVLLATAEELGLLGTGVYIENPVWPLERTVFNLNLEMIGRPDPAVAEGAVGWMVGWDYSDVGPALVAAGLPLAPDPHPEQSFFWRSDNMAFVRRGIVGQTISSYALHDDYHRVGDEADTLDWEHLATLVRAAYGAVRVVADGKLTPAWSEGFDPAAPRRSR